MTKQQFVEYVKREGVYNASLFACACGVKLPVVQLWLKGMKNA